MPRDLAREIRRLDEAQLRRLLILARGLLAATEGARPDPEEIPGADQVRYRQQHVRCGKDCEACPHGPYWYAHWTERGQRRSQYIGRELAADVRRLLAEQDQDVAPEQRGAPDPDSGAEVIPLGTRRGGAAPDD